MCIQVESEGKRERSNGERGRDIRRQGETDGKGKWQRRQGQGNQKPGRDRWRKGETDGDRENHVET